MEMAFLFSLFFPSERRTSTVKADNDLRWKGQKLAFPFVFQMHREMQDHPFC